MYRTCIFILLDGARPDVLGQLLQEKVLPNFYELFVKRGVFTRATTVFPSTTGPAYLPYLTGKFPGECNIPGIRWFDRKVFSKSPWNLDRCRSYVGLENYFFNRDLSPNVKTIFEWFQNPVNIFSPMSRGVAWQNNHAYLLKSYYALVGRCFDDWSRVDQKLFDMALGALDKRPDFMFLALPGIDELSHHLNPWSPEVLNQYRAFDRHLGKLLQALDQRKMLEETLILCAADHGLSAIQDHFDVVGFLERQGCRAFYYPKIYRKDFDIAIMPSGNAMAHLYYKNGKGWAQANDEHDLERFMDLLAPQPAISWVAARKKEGGIYVRSREGEAVISKDHGMIGYRVSGKDPLHLGKIPSKLSSQESLESSFDQKFPDALVQLLQLFESPRTGDLVLSAEPGFDLRLGYEWPEHRSSHGSLYREHMQVPVAISHPVTFNKKLRSVDLFGLMLELMGIRQYETQATFLKAA
ncbi:MAG: alkaline phosphatase family protein [Deltaproteobacteria bacterium]|nr:alkaline phosphatase family protein [Deltaproteobacteria bacterium]